MTERSEVRGKLSKELDAFLSLILVLGSLIGGGGLAAAIQCDNFFASAIPGTLAVLGISMAVSATTVALSKMLS